MKLRCVQNEEELTSTEQVPLDIEPDGNPGTNSTGTITATRNNLHDDLTEDKQIKESDTEPTAVSRPTFEFTDNSESQWDSSCSSNSEDTAEVNTK